VLVAEDREEVRNLALRVLRRYGYDVLEAATGAAALLVAAGHEASIHLLLTDVVMPEMGGRERAERLREARPYVKVIFMSGYTDDAVGLRTILEDGVDFIQKPFSIVELAAKVRAVLDG
jgi:CheY-like chemotaxis protein